jgi:PncC family amidohydrolase
MEVQVGALRRIAPSEYGVRFAFGSGISVMAGLVTLEFGVVPGGLLLAFPAVLPAALTLIERREGTDRAVEDTHGAVCGALGLVAFASCARALLAHGSALLALTVSLAAWIAVAYGTYGIAVLLRRVGGEELYLPSIPLSDVAPLQNALERAGLTVAVAESCTGGLLGALLTGVPGAGHVMAGGVIAYSDEVKVEELGVSRLLLDTEGAVSAGVAQAMAAGVRRRMCAGVGIGITGLVGAAAEGKPPGLTYVAVAGPGGLGRIAELRDRDGPMVDREQAVRAAIRLGIDVADAVARGEARTTLLVPAEEAAQPV